MWLFSNVSIWQPWRYKEVPQSVKTFSPKLLTKYITNWNHARSITNSILSTVYWWIDWLVVRIFVMAACQDTDRNSGGVVEEASGGVANLEGAGTKEETRKRNWRPIWKSWKVLEFWRSEPWVNIFISHRVIIEKWVKNAKNISYILNPISSLFNPFYCKSTIFWAVLGSLGSFWFFASQLFANFVLAF